MTRAARKLPARTKIQVAKIDIAPGKYRLAQPTVQKSTAIRPPENSEGSLGGKNPKTFAPRR